MLTGKIGEYKLFTVTKKIIEKENFIKELEALEEDIQQKIIDVLEYKGCVYGLGKKDALKAVYLFENSKDGNNIILTFQTALYTEEVQDKAEQFEKAILEELKEKVNWGQSTKVIWNDIEIEPKKTKGFSGLTFSTCLMFGVAYGIIFDNLALGLALGVAVGSCFEVTVKRKKG